MARVLYSRRGCHLCERAEDLVAARMPGVTVVDVDTVLEARRRFDLRVPVLEIDGAVVLEGRFEEAAVDRLAAAGP